MIVFVIRQFNDLDHITPIAYKYLQLTEDKVCILSQNPQLNIKNDYRLSFLKSKSKNLIIDYIYRLATPSLAHKLAANFLCKLSHPSLKKLRVAVLRKFFDKKWAVSILKSLKVKLLVFDHAEAEIFVYEELVAAAKELRIKTVGVPNGVPLFSEGYIEIPQIYRRELKAGLDHIIEPHDRIAHFRIKHGFDPKKVHVMGSPRFSQEWSDVLKQIIPASRVMDNKKSGKVKVVYMERGLDLHGPYKETIKETLVRLSQLEFVEFMIKPHTRSNQLHFKDFPGNIYLASEENSVNLIQWADVIIGSVSSILVEALLQKKILIYPKYFQEKQMLFEEKKACLTVHNYEELVEALKRIKKNPGVLPYDQANVEEFFREVIYAGAHQKDVLEKYVHFFQSLIDNNEEADYAVS